MLGNECRIWKWNYLERSETSRGMLQDFVVGYILFKSWLTLYQLVAWWLSLRAWVMKFKSCKGVNFTFQFHYSKVCVQNQWGPESFILFFWCFNYLAFRACWNRIILFLVLSAFEDIILENLLEISLNQNNFRIVICESRIELSSN